MNTNYYANITNRGLNNRDLNNCIGISIGKCHWLSIKNYYTDLAPTWIMVKNNSEKEYIKEYKEKLNKLNPQKVWDELHKLTNNPILLCYENPTKFCHRHLVAEWLEKELNVSIDEVGIPNTKRKFGYIV